MLEGRGHPDATPSVKGSDLKRGDAYGFAHEISGALIAETASADAMRNTVRRRCKGGMSRGAMRRSHSAR